MAQAVTTEQQNAAAQQLSQERSRARQKPRAKEPKVSWSQALLDTRNEPKYNEMGLSLGEGKMLGSPEDMRSKLLARRLGAKRIKRMAEKKGVDPNAFMNAGPRAAQEKPLNLQTEQGRSAQKYIDETTPESQKPRGVGDVDPTSVKDLRSQMRNLQLRRRQTQKGSAERVDVDAVMDRQRQRIQKAVKRKVEASVKRGIIYMVDFIAAALDISSVGVSLLIDFLFYLFTFGWLNLEMVYGRHFRQGKDLLISPISWDPIPVPVDEDAVVLQGFIVMADLAILFILFVLFMIFTCILYDYGMFMESPFSYVITLTTESHELCTGDIIKQSLGL